MRDALRTDLVAAMRGRDKVAVSALRSAIAALDNAEAVTIDAPAGTSSPHVAGAALGLGTAERPRRELSDTEATAVLRDEIEERLDAAEQAAQHGRDDHAGRLRAEADVLRRHLAPDV